MSPAGKVSLGALGALLVLTVGWWMLRVPAPEPEPLPDEAADRKRAILSSQDKAASGGKNYREIQPAARPAKQDPNPD